MGKEYQGERSIWTEKHTERSAHREKSRMIEEHKGRKHKNGEYL